MKKVIITGANGFIGTALLKELSGRDVEIYAVIRNKSSYVEEIKNLQGVHLIYCNMSDIAHLSDYVKEKDIDTCVHLAWEGSSGDERANYAIQLKNVEYSMRVVDVVAQMGVKRFVGIGSLAEKDVLNYHPMDGSTPNAVSIYGIAKVAAHFMTKAECIKMGLEHVWCLLSNTYGIGNTTNNFINMASKKMLKGERASFTEGEQLYDFVYITDTVRAICSVAQRGNNNTEYYLGSTKPRKLKEYIKIIRDTVDSSIELYMGEIPYKGNPLPEEVYDATKLIEDTGYTPEIDFEQGIKKTIDWLKATI